MIDFKHEVNVCQCINKRRAENGYQMLVQLYQSKWDLQHQNANFFLFVTARILVHFALTEWECLVKKKASYKYMYRNIKLISDPFFCLNLHLNIIEKDFAFFFFAWRLISYNTVFIKAFRILILFYSALGQYSSLHLP